MNTVTFYSFKGGVGRTLALANVAYELARSGSRVLVVDFDLEAPGLDSIFPSPVSGKTPGIVEFVEQYLVSPQPPDVRSFTYRWDSGPDDSSELLVMPAGIQTDSYARRLSGIDWVDLYERHQGYLMFEDLKAQWRKKLGVDYVLIDSRTGHTDVTGICTRQLPDTLVVTFFPNDQNLNGLRKVVQDVRSEPETTGRERIEILFVASNVPRLDDEESILQRRMSLFKTTLDTGKIGLVHRYDSLHLLDRPLFTRDRGRSRLARQFRVIADNLRMANAEDRRGALQWLDAFPQAVDRVSTDEAERRLRRIEAAHSTDGEVLFELGNTRLMFGQLNEAAIHFEQAIQTGFARPKVFLNLAETRQRLSQMDAAADSVLALLHDSSTTPQVLYRAVELLRHSKPEALGRLVGSQAVNDLPHAERIILVNSLDRDLNERKIAHEMITPLLQWASGHEDWFGSAQFARGTAALALGNAGEAEAAFRTALALKPDAIECVFNLAVARWALASTPDLALFERVLRIPLPRDWQDSPNYCQCIGLARHLVGDTTGAMEALEDSRSAVLRLAGAEFSCWRYLSVSRREFLEDLDEMAEWVEGAAKLPRFFRTDGQLTLPVQAEGEASGSNAAVDTI